MVGSAQPVTRRQAVRGLEKATGRMRGRTASRHSAKCPLWMLSNAAAGMRCRQSRNSCEIRRSQ